LPSIGIAGGFVLVGGAILIGTAFLRDSTLTTAGFVWPNARVYGCDPPDVDCDHIRDAMQTIQTAADVQMVTLIAMSIGATTFLSTGLLLEFSRDVQVQAAPAVGELTGLTVRGTF
jgi:hypothetical protein